MKNITRRDFFVKSAQTAVALSISTRIGRSYSQPQSSPEVVVVRNSSPAQLARKAVEELGGMSQFVKKGQTVLLKPNIGWDRLPEQAANTNPEEVAEVAKMCLEAGAKWVRVLDRTCNQPRRCYKRSGIEEAVKAVGGEVRHIIDSRFEDVQIPQGELVKTWPFYKDALDADVFINMPIAKHHNVSGVTLGFKNIMGVLGGDRGNLHTHFMTKIVDINQAVKPSLTIVDAYRILLRNGPSGGNLADTEEKKMVIAGTDRVAVDAYSVRLFGIEPDRMEYLKIANERGLGKMNLSQVALKEIDMAA
jgi:uncharacterized protein (DUF362 family)